MRQLLDVVRRELSAEDAYIQIGGSAVTDPSLVAHALDTDVRLVARFALPPPDLELARRRLANVADAFAETVNAAIERTTQDVVVAHPAARRALTDALSVLAAGARAVVAVVVDVRSPVMWGCSDAELGIADVELAEQLAEDYVRAQDAGLDPRHPNPDAQAQGGDAALAASFARLRARYGEDPAGARRDLLAARALAWARTSDRTTDSRHEADLGVHVRPFSGIYRLVLAFDGPFSELVAEPITRRALPVVARLVASLPPADPTPKGASVMQLRPK